MKISLGILRFLGFASLLARADAAPNVLIISVDDLSPQLNCYGEQIMQTPHMDRMASEGILFENAYSTAPVCGASRASYITGLKPSRNRFLSYNSYAEKDAPEAMPLHGHFQQHGYRTVAVGKFLHHADDFDEYWDEGPWFPKQAFATYLNPDSINTIEHARSQSGNPDARGPAYEKANVDDVAYPDGKFARHAMEKLEQLAQDNKPFFLTVGFLKPHLPFNAPEKYWNMYEDTEVSLPENRHPPQHSPPEALHDFNELRSYAGIPESGALAPALQRKLIHGYYACVSYIDAQIGLILQKVDTLNLRENTIVVILGDHGYHLGDHGLWCKHSLFENALHTPLIIRIPEGSSSVRTSAIVELTDLYPTLCDLADLPLLPQLEGKSMVPLFHAPESSLHDYTFAQHGKNRGLRSKRFRIASFGVDEDNHPIHTLYDHKKDSSEDVNVAKDPAYQKILEKMSQTIKQFP